MTSDLSLLPTLAQSGTAGLIAWMWLTERRAAATRDRQLTELADRLTRDLDAGIPPDEPAKLRPECNRRKEPDDLELLGAERKSFDKESPARAPLDLVRVEPRL